MFFDRVVDIYRLQKVSSNSKKESYQKYAPLADIAVNIQPATPEDTIVAEGVFGQAYVGFTTASGILEGDKIIVQQTNEVMIVRGKTNWMSPSDLAHVELLLTEFETSE